jgi:hypothetical protein
MSLAVPAADTRGPIDRLVGPGAAMEPRAWDRAALAPALDAATAAAAARPGDPDPAVLRAALLLRLARRREAAEAAGAARDRASSRAPGATAALLLARVLAVLGAERAAAEVLASLVEGEAWRSNGAIAASAAETAWLLGDPVLLGRIAEPMAVGDPAGSPASSMVATLREADLFDILADHQATVRSVAGPATIWLSIDLLVEEQWPPFVVTRVHLDGDWSTARDLEDLLIDRLYRLYTDRRRPPGCYLGHVITEFVPVPEAMPEAAS